MKKYLFGIFAIVLAIGFSAFTKPMHSKQVVTYGITSSDATYWYVEQFDFQNKECASSTGDKCSFDYPTSGQTQILKTDGNISNLDNNVRYQLQP